MVEYLTGSLATTLATVSRTELAEVAEGVARLLQR